MYVVVFSFLLSQTADCIFVAHINMRGTCLRRQCLLRFLLDRLLTYHVVSALFVISIEN